jgi:K+-transporting ATPase A subunit
LESILNQYSLIWISVLLLIVFGLLLFRQKPGLSHIIAFGVILLGLVYAWIAIHPRQTPLMENAQSVQDMIGNGQPVLLEFQSPY